jgi:anti-sigma regulatory factor (Ser/Thr protein kinase)
MYTSELDLQPRAESAAQARDLVRAVCRDRPSCRSACQDAELVVTELVANAVRHARTPVTVRLVLDDVLLRVEVCDGSTRPARMRVACPTEEGGRGLLLVDALSDAWGVEADRTGKRVWAQFARDAT